MVISGVPIFRIFTVIPYFKIENDYTVQKSCFNSPHLFLLITDYRENKYASKARFLYNAVGSCRGQRETSPIT